MVQIFQNRQWKHAAIVSYIGMHVGLLTLTVSLPLTLTSMVEEFDQQTLALHCISMKKIQYWLVGVGGITFILEFLSAVVSMIRNKRLHLVVTCAIGLFSLLVTILLIWGSVESAGRRSYFQETWNDMGDDTKYLIQTYFSCCGFENADEWTSGVRPIPSSCSPTSEDVSWPTGCYERVVSGYLDMVTVNSNVKAEAKVNPFVVAHFVSLLLLIFVQILSVVFLSRAILSTPMEEISASSDEDFVFENPQANGVHFENNEKGGIAMSNGHLEKQPPVSSDNHVSKDQFSNHELKNEKLSEQQEEQKVPWYVSLPDKVTTGLGNGFYWIGVRVAMYPKMTIAYSVLLVASMTLGFLQRYEIPPGNAGGFLSADNDVVTNGLLTGQTFLSLERDQYILIVDQTNVISTENFQTALDIDKRVKALNSSSGDTFSSICLSADNVCTERSLFEFWSFNNTVLETLSSGDIQTMISRTPLTSPVFGDNVEISRILGGIERSGSGGISSAKAHLLHYVTTSVGGDWEDLFVEVGRDSYSGVSVYVQSASSRRTETSSGYTNELSLIPVGFVLIFLYIMLTTGKLSLLEHRIYIALLGVVAAGLSMAGGIGLTPTFGLEWTTLHLIVPFLVIGIGVDDMFVLLRAWDTIEDDEENRNKSLEEKAGIALKTAGWSILITSLTDLVAFAVGATSELAGLASFSVFVAICVIILVFLQCTFFMACVVLDQRRRSRRYDACLACCYKHPDSYRPWKCCTGEIFTKIFEDGLGVLVTYTPFSIIIILVTLALTSCMAWGFSELQVYFDSDWYLPVGSYLIDYNRENDFYFNVGSEAQAYVIGVDFFGEREKLHDLYDNLIMNPNLDNDYTTSWYEDYVPWALSTKGINVNESDAFDNNATEFYSSVIEFLATSGKRYSNDIVFKSGEIYGSRFDFRHIFLDNEAQNSDIMLSAQESCIAANFSVPAFPYGRLYPRHEITRIIRNEVYRNLFITILCVFVIIFATLVSIQMGFWVGLCVLLTTVDVAGTMHFAGFSIEASTIIVLLLSVGLAVDYATHVGHKFLTLKGTRKLRARIAIGQIGVAVFNGGFSTFLSLVVLSAGSTYSFRVLFNIFASVVLYGLWNGLLFLPCVLSLVGPDPYASATEAKFSSGHREKKSKVAANQQHSSDENVGEIEIQPVDK